MAISREELRERLAALPRLPLAALPTPLEELKRLSAHLAGPQLWVKRDDLTGLAFGGNKIREFEYQIAQAVERGCDVLVHSAAAQSNQSRQTAAVAAKLGLSAVIVGRDDAHAQPQGNLLLTHLFGADVELPAPAEQARAVAAKLAALTAAGLYLYLLTERRCCMNNVHPTSEIVCSTYRIKGNEIGTMFTVERGGKQYMVTASHVLGKEVSHIYVYCKGEWKKIPVKLVYTTEESLDVSVLISPHLFRQIKSEDGEIKDSLISSAGVCFGQDLVILGFPDTAPHLYKGNLERMNNGFPFPRAIKGIASSWELGKDGKIERIFIDCPIAGGTSGGLVMAKVENRSCIIGIVTSSTPRDIPVKISIPSIGITDAEATVSIDSVDAIATDIRFVRQAIDDNLASLGLIT